MFISSAAKKEKLVTNWPPELRREPGSTESVGTSPQAGLAANRQFQIQNRPDPPAHGPLRTWRDTVFNLKSAFGNLHLAILPARQAGNGICCPWILCAWPLVLFLLCPSPFIAAETTLTARDILDLVDDLYIGKSGQGKVTMEVTTAHWKRALTMEFRSKGKDRMLLRILSPKKEKGTATLRRDKEVWNYLPKVKRVIKVPSSMMSASWMGSHFTNDDLVKETRMAEDYTFEISAQGERDGREVVEITCIPKEDAAVVWGKVVVTVREDDYLPVSAIYYDEDLELARTMVYSDIKTLGGRELPTKLTMKPSDKPAESTAIIYNELSFDVSHDDRLFSLRTLRR